MTARLPRLLRLVAAALVFCVGLSSVEVLWADSPVRPEHSAAAVHATDPGGADSLDAAADDTGAPDADDCPCLCACQCAGAQLVVAPAPAPEEPPAAPRSSSFAAPERAPASVAPERHTRPPLA